LILPIERLTEELKKRLGESGYSLIFTDTGAVTVSEFVLPHQPGRVAILTSGTSGEPKIIEHGWSSIFTMSRVKSREPANWLLTYQPGTYAWWQMVTLLLFRPGEAITIAPERTPVALIEAAMQNRVNAISATPTFWRLVLLQFTIAALRNIPLRQLTLGGEAVDQQILDRLKTQFPETAITHIYASSETGAAVVVHDGREGFPECWLWSETSDPGESAVPQLQIREGMLWIRSPYASQSGWMNSGDVCELRDGRVVVIGRESGTFISVGGAKVPAHEVERVLRAHPDVVWCRVKRRKAPFMGELVAADIVLKSSDKKVSEAELVQHCAAKLSEYMVPRFWQFLESIPVTENLKAELN
jgi:acyl-CoA synthetase (AMP-forming)/AMP-acid ligase II